MPVVVVALAAGSFAAGVTAFAAATTIAGMVAAGAVMAGAAMTMVGTVTGNQKLTKWGAIIGIAGGIGTALTSTAEAGAGAAAGDTATAGVSDAAAGSVTDATAGAAGDAVSGAASDMAGGAGSNVATGTGGGMLDAASASAPAASAPTGGMGGMLDAAPGAGVATDPLAQAQASTTSAFDASKTGAGQAPGNAFQTAPAGSDAFTPSASGNNDMGMPQANVSAGVGDLGALQQMQAWAKANPELARMALSAAGGAFGSLVPSPRDKAMMDAYRAQAAQTAAQTDAMKRKAAWGSGRTTY